MLRRTLILLLLPFLTVPPASGSPSLVLPDLGEGSIRMLAGTTEEHIGRSIVNELRRNNLLLEDPEVNEYIQLLGSRLVTSVENPQTKFTFFIVRDDSVNAFALPGGYIGVHSGLFLRTRSESELASVLAHEIVHVTQRHVARRFEASSSMGLKALAVMLGAIALAASGAGGDDVGGAMMLGQGLMLQEQINFTRSQEYESDRIGIELLAKSGFDPNGMMRFFEVMQRLQRLQNSRMPEFLSTHPLSLSRISEAAQRVQAMGEVEVKESRAYPLVRARLGVLTAQDPLVLRSQQQSDHADQTVQYAHALNQLYKGDAEAAVEGFRALLAEDDSIIHFHTGLGSALLEARQHDEALRVFERAAQLFPDNLPVRLAQARAQRHVGNPQQALQTLRDLFNRYDPQPEHLRIMAQTAADAGAVAESHYYMSEFYIRSGNINAARDQLRLAVERVDPASKEHLQYQARLAEVTEAVLELRRTAPRRERENQSR